MFGNTSLFTNESIWYWYFAVWDQQNPHPFQSRSAFFFRGEVINVKGCVTISPMVCFPSCLRRNHNPWLPPPYLHKLTIRCLAQNPSRFPLLFTPWFSGLGPKVIFYFWTLRKFSSPFHTSDTQNCLAFNQSRSYGFFLCQSCPPVVGTRPSYSPEPPTLSHPGPGNFYRVTRWVDQI